MVAGLTAGVTAGVAAELNRGVVAGGVGDKAGGEGPAGVAEGASICEKGLGWEAATEWAVAAGTVGVLLEGVDVVVVEIGGPVT